MQQSSEKELGRAKNAILELFEKRLYVPKIYLDAHWADQKADVLAIDRDGIGDVHLVLLAQVSQYADNPAALPSLVEPVLVRLESLPAQYKYVGLVSRRAPIAGLSDEVVERSLAADGLGLVGFISVEIGYGEQPQTSLLLKPERFRARVADMADAYVQQHVPDWELRA